MAIVAHRQDIFDLVAPDAELELLADGFHFTEGPVWDARTGVLLFTDLAGDTVWRWDDEAGRAREWRRPSNMANGMTRDPQGCLLTCEAATSLLTRTDDDGRVTVVASHFEGQELNSPNDVVCRSDGTIYFSDPPSGRALPHGLPRPRYLDFQGVFMVPPGGGEVRLAVADFELPNGLCFSPDESLLYINDSLRKHVRVFDVRADGALENGRLFFQEPGELPDVAVITEELIRTGTVSAFFPDGMKADERGNIYTGGPGGIWVIDPSGRSLGVIETPYFVGNLAFAGPDRRTLFVCACSGLYRLRMKVAGNLVPHLRLGAPAR